MKRITLDTATPIWDRFFTVAPLVLIGTRDDDGALDLAPKHMAMPMGWQNFFGFVCAPTHSTCANITRTGEFTVSYPKPSQVLYSSLAASPRTGGQKPVLDLYDTVPAQQVDGEFIADAYLFLECRHLKTYDDFGPNCLITGEIIAAYAEAGFVRSSERDSAELLAENPLLAYVSPGRFGTIERTHAFPFPADMKR
jgi:flavin reductase (DIM6/NTAB) family NADH-FMN oxidoreductase RutF